MSANWSSVPRDPSGLGLAWTLPVLWLFYTGLGYWGGGWLGSRLAGALVGWLAGLAAVFYEIRKVLRNGDGRPATPRPNGRGAS